MLCDAISPFKSQTFHIYIASLRSNGSSFSTYHWWFELILQTGTMNHLMLFLQLLRVSDGLCNYYAACLTFSTPKKSSPIQPTLKSSRIPQGSIEFDDVAFSIWHGKAPSVSHLIRNLVRRLLLLDQLAAVRPYINLLLRFLALILALFM